MIPPRKQPVRQPSPPKLPSAIDPALVDDTTVNQSLKSPIRHRRRKSSTAKSAGSFGQGDADNNDDDDFGDDFDEFEEGDEDADFGDFDDGFQTAEAEVSASMPAPQPQISIPSFVRLGPSLGSHTLMLTSFPISHC